MEQFIGRFVELVIERKDEIMKKLVITAAVAAIMAGSAFAHDTNREAGTAAGMAGGAAAGAVRRKAESGNDSHIGAPMPGVVSTLGVTAGQAIKAGDVLLSIEAMKMETALHAERDGTVEEVLVKAGDQIDAKDLLVVLS